MYIIKEPMIVCKVEAISAFKLCSRKIYSRTFRIKKCSVAKFEGINSIPLVKYIRSPLRIFSVMTKPQIIKMVKI